MADPALIEAMARGVCWALCQGVSGCKGADDCADPKGCSIEAQAALAALRDAGMAVVPVEATPAMKDAGLWALMAGSSRVRPEDVYRAMLAATGEKTK